jgi:hypothetical protein
MEKAFEQLKTISETDYAKGQRHGQCRQAVE